MTLERRIRALEGRLVFEAITLVMPDGARRKIRGDGDHLLELACEAMRMSHARTEGLPAPESKHAAELALIARSVSSDEQGAMLQLARNALTADPGVRRSINFCE